MDAIKTASGIAVGSGGLFALYLAARRQRTQEMELAQRERAQADTVHDAAERRLTEQFIAAVEQLGSDKAAVRLGGLFTLERVAQDNPAQRQVVVDVLCGYLRRPYALAHDKHGSRRLGGVSGGLRRTSGRRAALAATTTRRPAAVTPTQVDEQHREEREVRLTAQRILARHLRPGPDPNRPVETFWHDIDIDLAGAVLIDFDFRSCRLRTAQFPNASFAGHAKFLGVNIVQQTYFEGASIEGISEFALASFGGYADFSGVTFGSDTAFHRTAFKDGVLFRNATFGVTVRFVEAKFHGVADFVGATFAGEVDCTEAVFGGDIDFVEVELDSQTNFNAATFAGGQFNFSDALVAHPIYRDTWPGGWTPAQEHAPVADLSGTWHRLIKTDAESARARDGRFGG